MQRPRHLRCARRARARCRSPSRSRTRGGGADEDSGRCACFTAFHSSAGDGTPGNRADCGHENVLREFFREDSIVVYPIDSSQSLA